MPEDLPVTKCINLMVGITRSKVIFVAIPPHLYKQVPSPLPWVHAQVLENDVRLTQSNTNQSGSMFAHPMEVLSQPSPWRQLRPPASPNQLEALLAASPQGLAPGPVATRHVLVFIRSKEKVGPYLLEFWFWFVSFSSFKECSSCFYICGSAVVHLSCQIHMFSFQIKDLTTLLQSLRLLMCSSVTHLRHDFFTQWKLEHLRFLF